MSDLTNALERIEQWLVIYAPAVLETLNPGLDEEVIASLTHFLSFDFPDDLRQLYQWRNGHQGLVDYGGSFMPVYLFIELEAVMALYQEEVHLYTRDEYFSWNPRWLPLFPYETNYMLAVVGDPPQTPTQLIDFCREDPDYEVMHANLTQMMQTLAACYEAGVFQFVSHEERRFNRDTHEFETVTAYQLEYQEQKNEVIAIYQQNNANVDGWWFLC